MRRIPSTLAAGAFMLALVATDATDGHAQAVGLKLGASFSSFDTDVAHDYQRLTGFAGGGFVRFDFGRFGIQTELLSVSKGASLDGTPLDAPDLDISVDYIEIPVLLHVPLSMGQTFAPFAFAGPAVAFEVACDADVASTASPCDGLESTDIGIAAGGGFAFAFGPGALLLEGRYTWGMTNLNPASTELKNRSAYLMAGLFVPL